MAGLSDRIRPVRSALGRVLREAALYPRVARARGRAAQRVAFLPSGTKEQSALLRAWNIAAGLEADHGWVTLVVPPHLRQSQRLRLLGAFRPDVVVVQKCRHGLNRSPHLARWRVVLDVDDADFLDPTLTQLMADVAAASLGVICGSRFIRDWAACHARRTDIVWTGTPISCGPWPDHTARAPLIAWAQSSVSGYPGEFEFVCEVVKAVAARRGGALLRIYGWDLPEDHPSLMELRGAGVSVELCAFMPYADFLRSLRDVAVGLSPIRPEGFSLGKSFGKILGYLDAKVPVVCSDAADHSEFFNERSGVVSNDAAVWVARISALLDDPAARTAMSDAAHADFVARLSTAAAVRRVDGFLSAVLAPAGWGITSDDMTEMHKTG